MSASTYTLAGRTVHRIGYGAMQLPGKGVFGPPRDHGAALAVLRRAVDDGVDHIDTAQFYGPDVANALIFEALHPYPEQLTIVTKVGARRDDKGAWLAAQRPEELRAAVHDNLRSLGMERVHAANLRLHDEGDGPDVDLDDQLAEMARLREEGLIGGVGLSNVTLGQLDHALDGGVEVVCVQNPYNLADRSGEDVLRRCEEREIAYVPFFPLGSAFNAENPVLGHPAVVATAERVGASRSQVAMAWLLQRAHNVLLIPGTSSVDHLEENLAAGDVTLDAAAVAAIG